MSTKNYYVISLSVNVIVALCLGTGIVLILNVLNRSSWFALLSGLFCAMLFCALTIARTLFSSKPQVLNFRSNTENEGERQAQPKRQTIITAAYTSIVISGLLGIAAIIALCSLPGQNIILAFVNGVLGLLLCTSIVVIGMCVLVLFLVHRGLVS